MSDEPKSILYDARTVRPGMTGVGRAAYCLLVALARQETCRAQRPALRALFYGQSAALARRDPALEGVEVIEAPHSHESHPWGDLWLNGWLKGGLKSLVRPGELYHGPAFLIPHGPQPFPRVATIFDLFVFTDPAAYPLRFRWWLRRTIRRACRCAERVIVPTRTIADRVRALGLADEGRIAIVPPAADATPVMWETAGPDLDPFGEDDGENDGDAGPTARLLTIGTVDARKDPRTACVAALALRKEQPDLAFEWAWIGGAGPRPDPTPRPLAERAAAAGFRTVGPTSGRATRRALTRARAYVTCSRAEGFGIPLAEAMNAGCPIVATDLPVHREVAGDAAVYFPPGDGLALARVLGALLSDPAALERLRENGRRRAPAFDWDRSAAGTLEVYRRAAAGREETITG
jgi:glycosyltransferase involved in cell wall biosynthesis